MKLNHCALSRGLLTLSVLSLLVACGDDGGEDAGDVAADATADTAETADTADTTEPPPIVDIDPWIETCDDPAPLAARTYEAELRYNAYGVPYITGDDLGDVIFGQAYAQAKDHVCTLADQVVATRSERSRYFGPGEDGANLRTDFGNLSLGVRDKARCNLGRMSAEAREAVRAIAAGYNQYLADTGVDNLPADCAGADWVKPITELDVAAMHVALLTRASGQALIGAIADAAPPTATAAGPMSFDAARVAMTTDDAPTEPLASNGWGIGKERSASGHGMLFANPHFPWQGALRFHECQLTIPGELNVHGGALVGAPGVLIGFNKDVAWTHTVSASQRFTMYALTLDPSDPTVYVYGDERRRMAQRTVSIEVKQGDGSLETVERTHYYSHYGPIVSVAPLTWSSAYVLTFRDANINNYTFYDQWLGMDRASNLEEFKQAFSDFSGIPWVNTVYADKDGNAFYVDPTPVARMSDEALGWFAGAQAGDETGMAANLSALIAASFGAFCFDGSDPAHEWTEVAGAREPGLTPFSEAPQLERTDFVCNANDSHWLSNPAAPLEGYSPLYGPERTARSFRTRMNLLAVADTGEHALSGADGKLTFDELKQARSGGQALHAALHRDGVVSRCDGVDSVEVDGTTVSIADACATLAAWDGRLKVTSAGAPLWRELLGSIRAQDAQDALYSDEFDPDDPVATPSVMAPPPTDGPDPILVALAMAVQNLQKAGFAVDVTLGEAQFTMKGDRRLSVPGGSHDEGAINMVTYASDSTTLLPKLPRPGDLISSATGLTTEGYMITYGTSFNFVLEFREDGPYAEGLLTYSQSADPASPHFDDQTAMFAEDGWRVLRFTEAQLAEDDNLTTVTVSTE